MSDNIVKLAVPALFNGHRRLKFCQATGVMVGYILGVGMFGLPFLVAQAGLLAFLGYFVVFGAVQYFLHLSYANIIIATKDFHRFPGYAGLYLGRWGKHTALAAKFIGNLGALLAYLIILGLFLAELLGPLWGGGPGLYATLIFVVGAAVVYLGIGAVANAELGMSALLLLVILAISALGMPAIRAEHLPVFDWRYLFLPYGAMLMALDGGGSLPLVVKILDRDQKQVKRVVRLATGLSAAVVAIFVVVIVGVSGAGTSPDALAGLRAALPGPVVNFALVFGVLSILTSYLLVTEAVRETLVWDYRWKEKAAWAVAVFVPFVFYLFGFTDLTRVISFAGGAAGGLTAIMGILMFRVIRKWPERLVLFYRRPNNALIYSLIVLFALGIGYSVWEFFR